MNATETGSHFLQDNSGIIAVVLAYIVAGIHLTHPKLGIPRLVLLGSTGDLSLLVNHPRPLVFVLSGIAIILGVPLAVWGYRRRLIYALGMALMAAYVVGYFAWHFSGHGGFLPGREPLLHGVSPLEAVFQHLTGDVRALVSKTAEIALFVVLAYLYRVETRRGSDAR